MEFAKKITISTEEIFNTMIFMAVSPETPLTEDQQIPGCHISAMIGLTGDFSAMLAIHCPEPVGLSIAGAMLGIQIEEIDADVKDALGEISNMIAGGMKEKFLEEEIRLELSIPTAIAGKSYTISSPTRSNRVVIPFSVDQGKFFVEIKHNLT